MTADRRRKGSRRDSRRQAAPKRPAPRPADPTPHRPSEIPAEPAGRSRSSLGNRVGRWAVWALVAVPPFLISVTAEDAFRLPKLAAAEILALVSLLALAAGCWGRHAVSLVDLARRPATVFAALLAVAVLPGALWALHPPQWQRSTASLAIALGGLVLWSLRLDQRTLRRGLELMTVPAAALALLAILQAHRIFRPFDFTAGQGARYDLTSLAGSVGDLAAYLVLPALVLQTGLARGGRLPWRVVRLALLALLVYTLLLSETIAALTSLAVASLVLWVLLLPRRRLWLPAAALATAAAATILLVPGLVRRLDNKLEDLLDLELDSVLTGRPDAWKAAIQMFREHPWVGIGNGGYGASFATTKLELAERGVGFWSRGRSSHFVNAHNEYLEAAAEWGLWGMAAMVGAALVLLRRLRELWRTAPPTERALAVAGCAAFSVLALASFPLRMALTGYPWVLFAAWIFAESTAAVERENGAGVVDGSAGGGGGLRVPAWAVSAGLGLLVAPALVIHGGSLLGRLEASRIVRTTTQVAQLALPSGPEVARPILQANLVPLRRAAELDPLEVGVAIATGSHYFLLGNADAAIEGYQRGLAIAPRSTLYLNLGRALLLHGRREEAMARLADAVTLDPQLEREATELGWIDPNPGLEERNEREGRRGDGRRERRGEGGRDRRGDGGGDGRRSSGSRND